MRGLDGRVAIVTGGNTGIGAAVAERLSAEGVSVAIGTYEDAEGATTLAERLSSAGPRCISVACDVTDETSIRTAIAEVVATLGRPSILVNNAGLLTRSPFEELDASEWNAAIDVSLSGSYRCARATVPALRDGGGTIVNMASELVWLGAR